ncbi:UdgX family uracil-DNA binding protein [Luteolibacter flavescens]|uniref:Type-4 uracil-DNA glycosylase n=1 Tax=Luteolibacter flavescens TaxID=1859460 RepID=A0ABT3FLC5_9BACT|nr:UdgX family uracil-DNA binding protein [Luteolibacter flavescens]MCW1884046.1 UdgX family uracil-DNA binding protein [Luteolibacter flavescens]
MHCVDPGESFTTWRAAARGLVARDVPPAEVIWEAPVTSLFESAPVLAPPVGRGGAPAVPPAFVELAQTVACHADTRRWALLYRLLWRIVKGGERRLMEIASDADVAMARMLAKNVRREIHKMHAFVRFRKIGEAEDGRERFVAWFEPDHYIVEAGAPFFRKRFANMDWSIFTPKGCAHWIAEEFQLTPGVMRNPCDDPDVMEGIWRTYYRSIFNPARLKLKAMQSEMPKRYWKNLPEADLIEELSRQSSGRSQAMIETPLREVKRAPVNAYLDHLRERSAPVEVPEDPADVADLSLTDVNRMVHACRHCPLWEHATGAVTGDGPDNARIMIVGEQPGDREDLEGRPFTGPAGKLLDQALAEAGLDRSGIYVTNAVKHFKWTPRGKLRLHQKPAAGEIEACKPWLLAELSRVAPEIVILLGGTAAGSLLGSGVKVTRHRGVVAAPHVASRVILTVHPSYLLRVDELRKESEYRQFVADLKLAAGGS